MSKLRASRNTFQRSLNRHYYLTSVNPPPVRTFKANADELLQHLNKRSNRDETADSRTEFDKIYLGL